MSMETMMKRAFAIIAITTVSGCASLTGMGNEEFGCKGLPEKGQCMSPEQVYKASDGDVFTPPAVKTKEGSEDAKASKASPPKINTNTSYVLPGVGRPLPVRTPSEVMRIWIAPWEDEAGDLTMESLVYTEINKRRWVVGERFGDAATSSSFFRIGAQKQAGQKKNSDNLATVQTK